MKTLEHRNYYDILDVPADAGTVDIKRAYHDALATYSDDALETYALFSDEERAGIIKVIERAFDTLVDQDKRSRYNHTLTDAIGDDPDAGFNRDRSRVDMITHSLRYSNADKLEAWVQMKSKDGHTKALVDEVLSKDEITGQDLKEVRCHLGIELSEIYEITRISSSMITNIEEDRFDLLPAELYLKQFLRSYAEMLQIDPQPVVDGYMKRLP